MTRSDTLRLNHRSWRVALVLLGLGALALSSPARAVVELNITQGTIQPLPIAIPDFAGDGSIDPHTAREISEVVANDLRASGLFIPIDQAAFIEQGVGTDSVPRFDDWRVVNAQALVVGRIGAADGKLRAEFRLWDVFAGKQLAGEQFFARPKDARRIGHIIADAIYERITGEKGYFDTRIVFVDESGPKDKRMKRLAIMDQDGFNVRLLTTGQNLVLTPRFSPSTQEITYTSFEGETPKVYLLNIETGQKEIVGDFPRHDVCAPLLAGRAAHRHEPGARRQFQPVLPWICAAGARSSSPMTMPSTRRPATRPTGRQIAFETDRDGSQTDLRHGCQRHQCAPDQPRAGELLHAGLVAARRSDRLHQDDRRASS